MNGIILIGFYDRIALGLRMLSSVLRQACFEVHVVLFKTERTAIIPRLSKYAEYYQIKVGSNLIGCGEDVNPARDEEYRILEQYVTKVEPAFIGVSSRTATFCVARKTVELLRNLRPKARFVGGGYGPMTEPERFLEFLDYVVIGEGESIIVDLVSAADPQKVPGVAWLEGGRLKSVPPPEPADLNMLPYPDRTSENIVLIEDGKIRPAYDTGSAYDIFSSRGCPSSCTYCLACQWDRIIGTYGTKYPRWRQRSVDSVIGELIDAKKDYKISFVRFKDSIFSVNKQWVLSFLDQYDQKIGLDFHCFLDERFIDEDLIIRLKRSGLSL